MGTLLLKLQGNRLFNLTFFAPFFFIFDDLMMYRRRNWLIVKEITLSYNQIARVDLTIGILFSHLDIITTARDDISIRFVNKKVAKKAKRIIDRKIHHAHTKHKFEEIKKHTDVHKYERTLSRLKELHRKGKISKKEYDKKKRELLKKFD